MIDNVNVTLFLNTQNCSVVELNKYVVSPLYVAVIVLFPAVMFSSSNKAIPLSTLLV